MLSHFSASFLYLNPISAIFKMDRMAFPTKFNVLLRFVLRIKCTIQKNFIALNHGNRITNRNIIGTFGDIGKKSAIASKWRGETNDAHTATFNWIFHSLCQTAVHSSYSLRLVFTINSPHSSIGLRCKHFLIRAAVMVVVEVFLFVVFGK